MTNPADIPRPRPWEDRTSSVEPMPGGRDNYLNSLREICQHVGGNNLSPHTLTEWVQSHFGTGEAQAKKIESSLRRIGVFTLTDDRLRVGKQAAQWVEFEDDALLLAFLHSEIKFFGEMLSEISEQPRSSEELLEAAMNYGFDWESRAQVDRRRGWLQSASMIAPLDGEILTITDAGRDLLSKLEIYQPSAELSPTKSRPTPSQQAQVDPKTDFDRLVERTLWAPEDLEEVIDTLHSRRPQIVLAGPPGTSKTWVAESLALYLAEGQNDAVHVVQFHPTYAYEDFVEGLRPAAGTGGSIEFEVVEGVLVQAADQAREVDHPVVLVIDEMNRANLPSVFGELFYLLEYRDREIRLLQRTGFSLPNNLYIIGTMNTADRSIRSIDTALRRRFDIFECPPSTEILNAYYKGSSGMPAVPDLSDGMELLNIQLEEHLDRHHAIGHTFFMGEDFDRADLQRTWDRQVKPLIDEYFFDQPDIAKSFSIEIFWPE